MSNKAVILIDEDDVILSLIEKSLIGNNPGHQIISTTTPEEALEQLKSQPFDVIFTDLPLLTSRETHLLETIHACKTPATAIIATAYNYQRVAEVTVGDLTKVILLPKPVRMNDLQQVIARVFGKPNELMPEQSAAAEAAQKVTRSMLDNLRASIHARCILLSDSFGNIIHNVGNLNGISTDAITTLLCGGVATLVEAGKNIDENDVINLAFREGKQSDLYAINIGKQLVLIIVIDKGQYYERLGSVWYYARKTAVDLSKILENTVPDAPSVRMEGAMGQAYSDELDKLFS